MSGSTERERVEALRTLDLPRSARSDQIRARFISLARELHPDLSPGDGVATARFATIAAAYEVLRRHHRALATAGGVFERSSERYDSDWWRSFGHMV